MMTDRDDERLERLLRHDARQVPGDDGFTTRVMASLPPARSSRVGPWLRPSLILGSAALGSVLAFAFTPADADIAQGFIDLARLHTLTPAAIAGLALFAAMLLSAIVLAADAD